MVRLLTEGGLYILYHWTKSFVFVASYSRLRMLWLNMVSLEMKDFVIGIMSLALSVLIKPVSIILIAWPNGLS